MYDYKDGKTLGSCYRLSVIVLLLPPPSDSVLSASKNTPRLRWSQVTTDEKRAAERQPFHPSLVHVPTQTNQRRRVCAASMPQLLASPHRETDQVKTRRRVSPSFFSRDQTQVPETAGALRAKSDVSRLLRPPAL
ncbi:hypothetical protein KC365_g24 [Hortaea werneckii]|nr:hypothetical protein KC365_g24 [Hortaea werneckii]